MTHVDEVARLKRAVAAEERARHRKQRIMLDLHDQGMSARALAPLVGRSFKTVTRELKAARDGSRGRLISVGYEGRTPDELITALRHAEVQTLVDVRENAISRKRGFSKRALAEACRAGGITYRHEPTLGNPRSNRDGFRSGESTSVEAYRSHLDTTGGEALETMVELLRDRTVALLCFEADHLHCHRSIVAERILDLDPAVQVVQA